MPKMRGTTHCVDEEERHDRLVSLGVMEQLEEVPRLEVQVEVARRDHVRKVDTSYHFVVRTMVGGRVDVGVYGVLVDGLSSAEDEGAAEVHEVGVCKRVRVGKLTEENGRANKQLTIVGVDAEAEGSDLVGQPGESTSRYNHVDRLLAFSIREPGGEGVQYWREESIALILALGAPVSHEVLQDLSTQSQWDAD